MKTVEIRKLFLKYFEENGHLIIDSAPLVPINDPSLLWINAGITPLKKYFDGSMVPKNKRLVNSQKCIRTNDIENVGHTARHHTYFEMLGNFSVGDYFKKEAIFFAYDFLTNKKWLGLDKDRFYMTVYPSDIEAFNYWLELGIDESHIIKLEGNFWEIGDGPCGPCSELFYDRGEKFDSRGIECIIDDLENDRFLEVWNVVFSQFNSEEGLSRDKYKELPSKNIDTGMGLERIACIMQDVQTNFDIDLFMGINKKIEELSGVKYSGQTEFKVIADHIRTICLAIADGALPSNEGRGYVIRRILRRAVKYGKRLGLNEPFMFKIVKTVNEALSFYDFTSQVEVIENIVKNEEQKFFITLEQGEKKLEQLLLANKEISGQDAFILYDTYGFPIELTFELAKEVGVVVDMDGFSEYMLEQKERSRNSRIDENTFDSQSETLLSLNVESEFVGYSKTNIIANIIAIYQDDEFKNTATGKLGIILDKTPFYAESGGQVSDRGTIDKYTVIDVFKAPNGQHIHVIDTIDIITIKKVRAKIDEEFRNKVAVNHSTTHLLNHALKLYLGDHVKQQGSYVSDEYLRFDFTHYGSISDDDVINIENLVNDLIEEAGEININIMPIDDAKSIGAAALFGEKYGDIVRVVRLGSSLELCGGTHISSFNDIKNFAIVSIESKGSGVYRIVATTNNSISEIISNTYQGLIASFDELFEKIEKRLGMISEDDERESVSPIISDIENIRVTGHDRINSKFPLSNYKSIVSRKKNLKILRDQSKKLNKTLEEYEIRKNKNTFDFKNDIINISGLNCVIKQVVNEKQEILKTLIDSQMNKYNLDVIFVANVNEKIVFYCKLSENAINKGLSAGDLVKQAAIICEGNGGGRVNFAQAGGNNIAKIGEALNKIRDLIVI